MEQSPIDKLINDISKLPGLGRRSAQRIALFLLKNKDKNLSPLIESLNLCSREYKSRMYDGEVKGLSVVKPFVGKKSDVPSDATVLRIDYESNRGAILAEGINPWYSDLDTYDMTASVIDEAVRKIIAVGGDLKRIAILDNFCWPDPVESEKTPDGAYKLAQLVRSCKALYDYTTLYKTPAISGKDSCKNDSTRGGKKISIPPTLLFSLFGDHPDVRNTATSDFKNAGDKIYLVGESLDELGASEVSFMLTERGQSIGIGGNVPGLTNPEKLFKSYRSLSSAINTGLVKTAHDCSEGGIGVALAEMCIGGRIGATIDIDGTGDSSLWARLWGESLGRIVVAVSPEHEAKFLESMSGSITTYLGVVEDSDTLAIVDGFESLIDVQVSDMVQSWQGTLDMSGGEL